MSHFHVNEFPRRYEQWEKVVSRHCKDGALSNNKVGKGLPRGLRKEESWVDFSAQVLDLVSELRREIFYVSEPKITLLFPLFRCIIGSYKEYVAWSFYFLRTEEEKHLFLHCEGFSRTLQEYF